MEKLRLENENKELRKKLQKIQQDNQHEKTLLIKEMERKVNCYQAQLKFIKIEQETCRTPVSCLTTHSFYFFCIFFLNSKGLDRIFIDAHFNLCYGRRRKLIVE